MPHLSENGAQSSPGTDAKPSNMDTIEPAESVYIALMPNGAMLQVIGTGTEWEAL
jgi:hypothetical protein